VKSDISNVVETPQAELLATGFRFTEGPLWHPDGSTYFVDLKRSRFIKWNRATGSRVVRENTGEGNGTTLDSHGRILMCEGGRRRITRQEHNGDWITIAELIDGKRINMPNDIVCHSNGTIYFTDPGGRLPESERELDFSGVLMVRGDGQVSVATDECEYPNGLAFSPDEKVLYVSISRLDNKCTIEKELGEICKHQFIRAFDVQSDGTLTNNRIFADMSSSVDGVPDGMKVDSKGRIFCTGPGGCWVYENTGTLIGMIELPEIPANLAFGGIDMRSIFLTARTSLYLIRATEPGLLGHP